MADRKYFWKMPKTECQDLVVGSKEEREVRTLQFNVKTITMNLEESKGKNSDLGFGNDFSKRTQKVQIIE